MLPVTKDLVVELVFVFWELMAGVSRTRRQSSPVVVEELGWDG
jgi:hypothetical protein